MKRLVASSLAFAVLMLVVACGSAEAVTVFSNFDQYVNNSGSGFGPTTEYAEDFVAADHPFGVWDVTEIKIMSADSMLGTTSQANINIYEDGSGDVGALIHQLSNVTIVNDYVENTFTTSGLQLNAGTTYWLGLEAVASWVSWLRTKTNDPTHPDYDGGRPTLMDSGIYDGNGHIFALEGTPIPEPTTMALLGLGAAVLIAWRKRA
jgi:hypothetical protein